MSEITINVVAKLWTINVNDSQIFQDIHIKHIRCYSCTYNYANNYQLDSIRTICKPSINVKHTTVRFNGCSVCKMSLFFLVLLDIGNTDCLRPYEGAVYSGYEVFTVSDRICSRWLHLLEFEELAVYTQLSNFPDTYWEDAGNKCR